MASPSVSQGSPAAGPNAVHPWVLVARSRALAQKQGVLGHMETTQQALRDATCTPWSCLDPHPVPFPRSLRWAHSGSSPQGAAGAEHSSLLPFAKKLIWHKKWYLCSSFLAVLSRGKVLVLNVLSVLTPAPWGLGRSLLAPPGTWGLPSFPADCCPICSRHSSSFPPGSPCSPPECWLPDSTSRHCQVCRSRVLPGESTGQPPACGLAGRGQCLHTLGAEAFPGEEQLGAVPGGESHPGCVLGWDGTRMVQGMKTPSSSSGGCGQRSTPPTALLALGSAPSGTPRPAQPATGSRSVTFHQPLG